ncbi:MAG: hypothetical protein J5I47_12565 [Vicingus serpentipes]|nr:hypothetical protein [Vicingus serpentipes]
MKKLLFTLTFLAGIFNLTAQKAVVKATMDTNFILIGEQAHIELSITYRVDENQVTIQFPQIHDTINKFVEIVDQLPIDTLIPDKEDPYLFEQIKTITITSFDSGYYAIPPFQFIVNEDTLETEPLLIEVQTVPVDTAAAIFDIKSPLDEPFSIIDWLKDNWIYLLGTLALIIVIILLVRYLRNRPKEEMVEEVIPVIPPHIIALEKLEKVKNEKLWQSGKVKQYHSEISEILRTYIEQRYQVNALEETTAEIMHELRLQNIDTQTMNKLNKTLVLADLVKFAKEQPLANENDISMIDAIEFINQTKLIINKDETPPAIPSGE